MTSRTDFLRPLKNLRNIHSNAMNREACEAQNGKVVIWMTDEKERALTISDDALLHPVRVTQDMACRARQSKERYGQKMEQGMGDQGKPQRRTNNCRSGPEQQLQQRQIWARSDKL